MNEFTIKRILEKQEYKYKAGSRPENITSKFVRQWSLWIWCNIIIIKANMSNKYFVSVTKSYVIFGNLFQKQNNMRNKKKLHPFPVSSFSLSLPCFEFRPRRFGKLNMLQGSAGLHNCRKIQKKGKILVMEMLLDFKAICL